MTRRVIKSDLALNDLAMPGIGQSYETTNPSYQDFRCFPVPKSPPHIVYSWDRGTTPPPQRSGPSVIESPFRRPRIAIL
jgi:hypothetical protein